MRKRTGKSGESGAGEPGSNALRCRAGPRASRQPTERNRAWADPRQHPGERRLPALARRPAWVARSPTIRSKPWALPAQTWGPVLGVWEDRGQYTPTQQAPRPQAGWLKIWQPCSRLRGPWLRPCLSRRSVRQRPIDLYQRAREDSNLRPTVSAAPRLSPRTGPSLHPPRSNGGTWVGCRALPTVVLTTSGAGVLPGRLTRWSLHLPPALPLPLRKRHAPPAARLGIAHCPCGQGGFPRIHPVRLGPFLGRAPLRRRKPSLYPAELRALRIRYSSDSVPRAMREVDHRLWVRASLACISCPG